MDGIFIWAQEKGGDPTALVALLVAIATLGWTIYWERTSARRRLIDEYWYRQIVGPNCVTPIIDFLNSWIDRLPELGVAPSVTKVDEAYEAFCAEKNVLLSKLWLSKLFSDSFYEDAEQAFDDVEDVFAQELSNFYAHKKKRSLPEGNLLLVREKLIGNATNLLVKAAGAQADKLNGKLAGR